MVALLELVRRAVVFAVTFFVAWCVFFGLIMAIAYRDIEVEVFQGGGVITLGLVPAALVTLACVGRPRLLGVLLAGSVLALAPLSYEGALGVGLAAPFLLLFAALAPTSTGRLPRDLARLVGPTLLLSFLIGALSPLLLVFLPAPIALVGALQLAYRPGGKA